MALSKDEKRRVYETEQLRLKARKDSQKSSKAGCGCVVLVILGIIAAGGVWLSTREENREWWSWLKPTRSPADDVMARIRAVAKKAAPEGVGRTRYPQMAKILAGITDVAVLREVFYRCVPITRQWQARPGVNPYWQAEMAVLFRLAELRTDAAAKVLVGLLSDGDLRWEGEAATNIGTAITRCGPPCLPYLDGLADDHAQKKLANRSAALIRSGGMMGGDTIDP